MTAHICTHIHICTSSCFVLFLCQDRDTKPERAHTDTGRERETWRNAKRDREDEPEKHKESQGDSTIMRTLFPFF